MREGPSAEDMREGPSAADMRAGSPTEDPRDGLPADDLRQDPSPEDTRAGSLTEDPREDPSADDPSQAAALRDDGPLDFGVGPLTTPSITGIEREDDASEGPALELLAKDPTVADVRELLHDVIDPELGLDIVELGLLREVAITDGSARVRFTVTTPACPLSDYIEDEIRSCLLQVPGLHDLDIACVLEPPWKPDEMTDDAKAALGWGP